ncbi:hypothetical protein FACS1894218_5740 [Bacilli bacterium]|nr:hypothetical protein FACS1894218_5740 [Bacilli bacterium]
MYVTTPSLQSKYVMQHSSNVYFEITLFKAPTTVNFNSAIPYENSTYTTNTILLNFNEDMGNALETTNVKVISTTDDNSVEVEVTHVERS